MRDRRKVPVLLTVLLTVAVLLVVLVTKFVLVGSDVARVVPLEENKEHFRAFDVSAEVLGKLAEENTKEHWTKLLAINLCKQRGEIKADKGLVSENSLYAMLLSKEVEKEYQRKLLTLLGDVQIFPVPQDGSGGETISYVDSWGKNRSYGGERSHEGCDIMTSNNEVGYFPVQSMSDGIVEKIGWLELGGYRIGIRAPGGAYFYYAHLDAYAEGLELGSEVEAGQTLGRMGNSGYGKEGTKGKFDTHLHMGIYMDLYGKEVSINPYQILRFLEKYRKTFYGEG